MICGTNKLLAILEAADEMNMMKKALPFCKQMGSAFLRYTVSRSIEVTYLATEKYTYSKR